MPTDVLRTVFLLDDQYSAGAKKATAATQGLATAFGSGVGSGLAKAASFALAELDSGTPVLGEIVSVIKSATIAAVGFGSELVGMSADAMKTAGDFEALKLGLQVYAGSAEATEKQLMRLREVARLPGLGFREAIEGSVRLQAVGADARLAERALMAFGNAVASSGGGKEQLDGVILALTQIISKGSISAEEINQIAERVPQIRKVLKDTFGTADTEALQGMGISAEDFVMKVIAAFEKLPKAITGAKNAFENIGDVSDRIVVQIGDALNKALLPALNDIGGFFDYLENVKVFDTIVTGLLTATNNASAFAGSLRSAVGSAEDVSNAFGGIASGPLSFLGESTDFGDALVRAASIVVGEFIKLPAIFEAVMTIIDENMARIRGFINQVIDLVNSIIDQINEGLHIKTNFKFMGMNTPWGLDTSTPAKEEKDKILKFAKIGDDDQRRASPGERRLKDAIDEGNAYANQFYTGYRNWKQSDEVANDKSPGGFVAVSAAVRTANATEKMSESMEKLSEQLLGGSSLAKQAVSARNIGRATGRASGDPDLDQGFAAIERAFQRASGMASAANRRAGAY